MLSLSVGDFNVSYLDHQLIMLISSLYFQGVVQIVALKTEGVMTSYYICFIE